MIVRTRLLLLGAAAPVTALVVAAIVAGLVLERRVRAEVDQHLTAQAAVESVGLFDAPGEEVHLHAHVSPLAADLDDLIPDGAVYDAAGRQLMATHRDARVPAALPWDGADGAVVIRTVDRGRGAMRELVAAVRSPSGKRYTLYLGVPMRRIDRPMRAYWLAAGGATTAVAIALIALQLLVAARLARRITALSAYLPRLREGQAEPPPPVDRAGDEVAALRDGLYAAARTLETQRAHEARWLAAAAHDLRTPLGVIRTTVDLALRRDRSVDELRAALTQIGEDVERLRALAGALLEARREPRRHAPLDLSALATACVGEFAPAAEAAGVTLRVTGGAAPLIGDALGLRRALDNLVHNAIAHAPAGTTIEVVVESPPARRRLRVRDLGPGIPAEAREVVFHPFHRGPGSAGAGLGLAIVRQVAGEHGGEAYVTARTPGAEVVIDLPVAAPDPP